jgi:S-adenosylmethionine:tRNA ribosyltransferase-isomerase
MKCLKKLEKKGVGKAFVTLHVGAGTFLPVKSDNIEDHHMHKEFFNIEQENLKKIQKGNLIAVGTTSLRTLESCCDEKGNIALPEGDAPYGTEIFLYPGKEVHSIKGLITNFHLPESSLLMLVSSIIGREKTLELYKIAIENKYRFLFLR